MLENAKAQGFAVGAFNVENLEMAMAVISAGEELNAPLIIQITPSTVKYGGVKAYFGIISALARNAKIPVALHLDHGSSLELVKAAVEAGYTSIMIDGSKLPLNENIKLTKAAVDYCGDIPVEGELGQVGGKEDDTECENAGYTVPSEAVQFEGETGVSSLAVGVGTAHGVYAVEPVLNVELITELSQKLSIPLVLHGASGLEGEVVKDCIKRGICKVNFATELRYAYTDGVRDALKDSAVFDPKVYGKAGIAAVKAAVKERILICGCQNKG